MSENLDLVRSIYAEWERGDWSSADWAVSQENVEVVRDYLKVFTDEGLEAPAEFWHPDIDWRAAEGAIDDAGEIHGTEAMRRYAHDWLDTFDNVTFVPEELLDVGDDRV